MATAFVYPIGFIICIMSGNQLFTEHTATAVYPVLDRRARWPELMRLWGIVIGGNLCGTFASAVLMTLADGVIDARAGYVEIGEHLVLFTTMPLLLSAVLAGWLMAQGAWMVLATSPAFSQMLSIFLATFLIGIGGLHHSIAGSAEMFVAVLSSDRFAALDALRFIGTALLGNLLGGSLFVAVLNYAHIRETQRKVPMVPVTPAD
jgi:formate/nitrite transporter FocA (FNT family)